MSKKHQKRNPQVPAISLAGEQQQQVQENAAQDAPQASRARAEPQGSPAASTHAAPGQPAIPQPYAEAILADSDEYVEEEAEAYGSVGEPEAFVSVGEPEAFTVAEMEAMMSGQDTEAEAFLDSEEHPASPQAAQATGLQAEAERPGSPVGPLAPTIFPRAFQAFGELRCHACSFVDSAGVAAASRYEQFRREGLGRFAWSAVSGTAVLLSEARQAAAQKAVAAAQLLQAEAKEQALAASLRAVELGALARTKASEVRAAAVEVASEGKFQATAVGAASGAAALGVTGGAAGMATGTVIGAAIGIVPAIITFGLSIPIGMAIGASTGLVLGTGVGGTAGALGGGAAGYGAYAKRSEIREGAQQTLAKVGDCAEFVKDKASASVGFVKQKAAMVRTRLVGGTGGTESSD